MEHSGGFPYKQANRDKSLEGDFHKHLSEFANPKDYAPTVANAEDFLRQLLVIWPDWAADELAPSVLGSRKQWSIKRTKVPAALSIGSNLSSIHLRSRRGAS
jgi:hypothetical protein